MSCASSVSSAQTIERLRTVLDTNIYVSAFESPRGGNAAVLRAAQTRLYQLVVSPAIIGEISRVLRRDFRWQEERLRSTVRIIAKIAGAGLVKPRTRVRAVSADPADDIILECAVDGQADIIVSNDHHLLNLNQHAGIPIVTGGEFRRILGIGKR